MSDKYVVKVNQNPEIRVSESTTIVKKVMVGTPIKSVDQVFYDASTLAGDSAGFYRDYNNLLNKPTNIVLTGITDNVDSGGTIVTGNIVPDTDVAYNLGSPDKKFKELFLAGETIFLGGTVLADAGNGTLSVGPAPAAGESVDSSLLKPLESFDSNRVIDTINDWIRGDDFIYDSTQTAPGLENFFDSAYVLERAKGASLFELNTDLENPGLSAENYVIDTFAAEEYRTLKYLISLHETDNNKHYSSEILFTHDNTNVYMTEYGVLQTDSDLGIIDANIVDEQFELSVTPYYVNTTIRAKRINVEAYSI